MLVFLFGIGPLALLLGADSRQDDPRGWWPGTPRRPEPGLPAGGREAVATSRSGRSLPPARWARALLLNVPHLTHR